MGKFLRTSSSGEAQYPSGSTMAEEEPHFEGESSADATTSWQMFCLCLPRMISVKRKTSSGPKELSQMLTIGATHRQTQLSQTFSDALCKIRTSLQYKSNYTLISDCFEQRMLY